MTLRAIDAHPAELSRTVRYEDLLADNGARIDELDGWVGLTRGGPSSSRCSRRPPSLPFPTSAVAPPSATVQRVPAYGARI